MCRWLSGRRKTRLVHYFSTLTSESINLTLSWIHIPILLFRGGEKLGRPILSPPWQDKAWTMCRWLSGRRKTRLVHYFPTLTSESINLTLSWIHIPILLFRGGEKLGRPILSPPWLVKVSILCRSWLSGWRKTRLVHYFPTLTSESINLTLSWICKQPLLSGGGEKLGRPILSPPWLDESINHMQMVIWVEKNSAGPLFSHPDKWKHQPYPVMNTHTTFAF